MSLLAASSGSTRRHSTDSQLVRSWSQERSQRQCLLSGGGDGYGWTSRSERHARVESELTHSTGTAMNTQPMVHIQSEGEWAGRGRGSMTRPASPWAFQVEPQLVDLSTGKRLSSSRRAHRLPAGLAGSIYGARPPTHVRVSRPSKLHLLDVARLPLRRPKSQNRQSVWLWRAQQSNTLVYEGGSWLSM